VADVRHAFSKFSGNMGADGSVAYMFNSLGILTYKQSTNEDILMEIAIDAGADDIITEDDGSIEIIVQPLNYEELVNTMINAGHEPDNKEITWRCSTVTNLNEHEAATMIKMTSALEDLDDVQTVYSNAEITDEVLAKL
jgi:transcriptional/translational regulatory protein YebC/TACO1